MKSLSLNHKLNILKLLFDTGYKITASQLKISNANQYFISLEELKLISRVEVPRENKPPFKVGFINQSTRQKAKKFLKEHNKLNAPTPLHILNSEYAEDENIIISKSNIIPTKMDDS